MRQSLLIFFRKTILFFKKEESTTFLFTNQINSLKNYPIGDYTYGKPKVIYPNKNANLRIGKFCSIAKNVTIFLGGNHRVDWISTYPFFEIFQDIPTHKIIAGHPSTKGDVTIGNDVWIGRNVTILSGVKIGNGAVIAAGAVITKNIGCYEIWGGNPAKMIKKRFDQETIEYLEKLKWWDWDLDKIKSNVDSLCSNNINQITSL